MGLKCWIIADRQGNFPAVAGEIARLRGLDVALTNDLAQVEPEGRRPLIAFSGALLSQLSVTELDRLREWVRGGATVYIRGGFEDGKEYRGGVSDDIGFKCRTARSAAYSVSAHGILPAVIAGESAKVESQTLVGAGLNGRAQPLIVVRDSEGKDAPSVFSVDDGTGRRIYDLNPDIKLERPLLAALSEPVSRAATIAALAAVDWAAARDPAANAAVNFVIDDRPANLDYFSLGKTRAFLQHLENLFPGGHIDFAWTPNQSHPRRRYLELLSRFNTGFVWHGFCRHIDHRAIAEPLADLELGKRLVSEISRKYRVRFQPVMIFPFERDTPEIVDALKREGFIAKAECVGGKQEPLDYRLRLPREVNDQFVTLYRQELRTMTRERMLAMATLGMPLIALVHPRELALRRLRSVGDRLSPLLFDGLARFAVEKHLRPTSLQAIAEELLSRRG